MKTGQHKLNEGTVATITKPSRSQLSGLDPELVLLGAMLQQACRDALQTAKPTLSAEAWQFLTICAPTVAERLRLALGMGD